MAVIEIKEGKIKQNPANINAATNIRHDYLKPYRAAVNQPNAVRQLMELEQQAHQVLRRG